MSIYINNVSIVAISAIVAIFTVDYFALTSIPPPPKYENNTWWGQDNKNFSKENKTIRPFKIHVSNEILNDLKLRLELTRPFTPSLDGIEQEYGMNANLMNTVLDFWKNQYDWRKQERFLNKFPQFKTSIQGLQIHFIHAKPPSTYKGRVFPLLMLHGWGGSVREFYDIIPILTTPSKGQDFVFEVIAPSLPGFIFSEATTKPGLGIPQMAVIFNNLMARLRFEKYYVQGGDWGGVIITVMAGIFPENVLGMHSNLCIANTPLTYVKLNVGEYYPPLIVDKEHEAKLYPLQQFYLNLAMELGKLHLQASKPDTLGMALNDSPVGLAAYLLEKFTTWTSPESINKPDGGLTARYSYIELIDNIMLYWVTNSITTSMRAYAEARNCTQGMERIVVKVPSACAKFKNEIIYFPDSLLRDKFMQLVQSNEFSDGGHFAALEKPQILADDIWAAVKKFEDIHNSKNENEDL